MAEAAGLAVGVVSLGMCLKACLDLFETFHASWKIEKDFTIVVVKFNIEKALLLQWAQQSGLISRIENPNSEKVHLFIEPSIALPILQAIESLLSDGQKLQMRYGA